MYSSEYRPGAGSSSCRYPASNQTSCQPPHDQVVVAGRDETASLSWAQRSRVETGLPTARRFPEELRLQRDPLARHDRSFGWSHPQAEDGSPLVPLAGHVGAPVNDLRRGGVRLDEPVGRLLESPTWSLLS